ncbi:hypothetical protein TRFO_09016 [Tritrichomonas foetus]|uniref:Uncharacterized protein n=1 Tax=Tritrichomonas foetus TaxID=1144522 RepID=A0A1J4JKS9_9EUKA|nr:hypothetical protein TRFO_09016 [Tritrichomonas foetus]|eukprot:OHS98165.1 hypothetical protein TRFO_09016 [Tritrichomonas foetus]
MASVNISKGQKHVAGSIGNSILREIEKIDFLNKSNIKITFFTDASEESAKFLAKTEHINLICVKVFESEYLYANFFDGSNLRIFKFSTYEQFTIFKSYIFLNQNQSNSYFIFSDNDDKKYFDGFNFNCIDHIYNEKILKYSQIITTHINDTKVIPFIWPAIAFFISFSFLQDSLFQNCTFLNKNEFLANDSFENSSIDDFWFLDNLHDCLIDENSEKESKLYFYSKNGQLFEIITIKNQNLFETEKKLYQLLQKGHQNQMLKYYGSLNQTNSLIFEFASKNSLRNFLNSNFDPSFNKKVSLFFDLAAGLDFLHSNIILFNNFDLDNFWIDKNDHLLFKHFTKSLKFEQGIGFTSFYSSIKKSIHIKSHSQLWNTLQNDIRDFGDLFSQILNLNEENEEENFENEEIINELYKKCHSKDISDQLTPFSIIKYLNIVCSNENYQNYSFCIPRKEVEFILNDNFCQDDKVSHFLRGYFYNYGYGVGIDEKKACEFYHLSAKKGFPPARFFYAGKLEIQNFTKKAYKNFLRSANQNYKKAQFKVGFFHHHGICVDMNLKEAKKWYKLAANRNSNPASKHQKNEATVNDKVNHCSLNNNEKYMNECLDEGCFNYENELIEDTSGNPEYNLGLIYLVECQKIKSFQWFWKSAQKHHSDAQYKVGHMLEKGEGITKNPKEAQKWYEKASSHQNSKALFALGIHNLNGNKQKSIEMFKRASYLGNIKAQFTLGMLYYNGEPDCIKQDKKQAFNLFLKAAKQNHHESQYMIGIMLFEGDGCDRNKDESFNWLLKSFNMCNLNATQFILSTAYKDLNDEQKGIVLNILKEKANQNNPEMIFYLAKKYYDDKEFRNSYKWFMKSVICGSTEAMIYLSTMLENGEGVSKDFEKSVFWLTQASNLYNSNALYRLGICYLKGRKNVIKNPQKGIRLLTKAANLNHIDAQFQLGWFYNSGRFVKGKDFQKSAKFYKLAAENGNIEAMYNLAYLYHRGNLNSSDFELISAQSVEEEEEEEFFEDDENEACSKLTQDTNQYRNEAIFWYKKAADSGHLTAQFTLATLYDTIDKELAFKYYKMAADQGDINASVCVALKYSIGEGVEADRQNAFQFYLKAADKGNRTAQFNVAIMLDRGQGVPMNKSLAFEYFLKAAEQGHQAAQYSIGWAFDNGEGVTADKKIAFQWYQRIAEKGYRGAQHKLGEMYEKGLGVKMNINEALNWYSKAAEQGYRDSQFRIGKIYEIGEKGINKDLKKAIYWYKLAARNGQRDSMYSLGMILLSQNRKDAIEYIQKAADEGFGEAQLHLGMLYYHGVYIKQDKPKAYKWFLIAADQKNGKATYNAACMALKGDGIPPNKEKALMLFKKAAEIGENKAKYELGLLYYNGEIVIKDKIKAFSYFKDSDELLSSLYNEAVMIENGEGTEKNVKLAKSLYKIAATKHLRDAQFNLGLLYMKGEGIKHNHEKAFHYFYQAAIQGLVNAQYNVGLMYLKGDGVQMNRKNAVEWFKKASLKGHQASKKNLTFLLENTEKTEILEED